MGISMAKGAGGQPTKYNASMQLKADEYVCGGFRDGGDVIPTLEGMAQYLGVSRKTLFNWSESHDEFLHSLDACNAEQKKVTLNLGLTGDFNATIAKLVLANQGMHDKQDVKQEGDLVLQIGGKVAKV